MKSYRVAGVNRVPIATVADVGGQQQNVTVNGVEVELVPEDAMSSSITWRFIGDQVEAALADFVVDEVVTLGRVES